MNVLAIDQGTSSTKALILAPTGEVLGQGSVPVHPRAAAEGVVEQDPRELLDSIVAAGRQALADAGEDVGAIGLANQGETVLRWDPATGEPHGPALSWQDRRAAEVTRELAASADRLEALTGLPLDPYFAAPKMTWLRRQSADGGTVTTVDAWINHRLTGSNVTDTATASRTMLLDLDRATWSDEACSLFGIDPAELPAVVGCDAPIGTTDVFGPTLPVTGLCVDQQAALFAESCFAAGEAKCTYGTGAFLLATTGEAAVRSGAGLAACVAWQLDGVTTYCLDGQVYTAGSAIDWLRRIGVIDEQADLDRFGRDPGEALFVPALAGLGAPFWAPHARAGWTGLSLACTREHIIGAVVWGIAAQVASLANTVARDTGRALQRLRVDGGLTRSNALLQAQADLLQAPVERYPSPDATAIGVGALAMLGAGAASSAVDAVGQWRPAAVVGPRMGPDEAGERLARWEAAAAALAALEPSS